MFDEPEARAEDICEGLGVVALHRQAGALLGAVGSERRHDEMASGRDGSPRCLDIATLIIGVDEKVEDGAVVP